LGAHRRLSGHILPGVDEETEPKTRRKHTTGSIKSTDEQIQERKSSKTVSQPTVKPRKSIQEQVRI
jgi:hypothetical protein